MATFKKFEEIECWKKARELTRRVYDVTNEPGFARDFGLKDQIRRAAVSIMSNIGKGTTAAAPQNSSTFYQLPRVQRRRFAANSMWRPIRDMSRRTCLFN